MILTNIPAPLLAEAIYVASMQEGEPFRIEGNTMIIRDEVTTVSEFRLFRNLLVDRLEAMDEMIDAFVSAGLIV